MSHFKAAAALGCLCLSPLAPVAQTVTAPPGAASGNQTIVVTASRLPQPLAQVAMDLRVIDRAQIAAAGASDLAQLLQSQGGVELTRTGGAGQISGVFLRGSSSSQVLVLIDGVRLNSATSGTTALEHLPLALIERIEVLHGPASGLYGADAVGGVIQIFTRRQDAAQVQLGLGSDRLRFASAGLGGRLGGGSGAGSGSAAGSHWSINLGQRESREPSATNPTNTFSYNADADPYRNRHLGAELAQEWAPGQTLTLRGQHSDAQTHFDAGPGSDDLNHQRLSTLALESRNRVSPGWTSLLRLARGRDAAVTEGAYPGHFSTSTDQFSWQNDLAVAGGQVAAGAEWRHEQVASDTAYSQTGRRVGSLFGSWAGAWQGHQLQLALRHDRDSQFGGHSTGNAGWRWPLAAGWSLSAAAGTAFKAPSFNDLYYPLQWGYGGNPALQPERSRSVEFGARYAVPGLSLGATVFDHHIDDLIVINDSFSSVDNLARARIRGLVLNGRWTVGAWTARADATLQTPENADTGAQLVRRARRHGSAGLDWAAGAWRAGASLVAAGERYDDGANSAAARLGGYTLLALHASWRAAPGWTLGARVDNLADKVYMLVRGYNPEGRRAQLTLAWDGF